MTIQLQLPPSTIAGVYAESYSNLSASAGSNTTSFTTVPAGQVWVIEGAAVWDATTKIGQVSIRVYRDGGLRVIARIAPTAALDAAQLSSPIVLFPGEYMAFQWNSCTLNDDIYAECIGIKFDIDLGI